MAVPGRAAARRAGTRLGLCLVGAALLLGGGGPAAAQDGDGGTGTGGDPADGAPPRVLATTVDDSISPVVADHLSEVIGRGEDDGYDAVVVQLDTPGGLDRSMRDIVQRLLAAEVPVVVYVSPDGARAASAGALITFAGHVAAMAPGTAIGAATPVQVGGGEVSDADRKAINDAAAFAESVAEVRGRDVDFAVDAVREGTSVSAGRAVEIGAVDLQAASLDELLEEIDGTTVEVGEGDRPVTLDTANAEVDTEDMGLFRQIQQILADPNLAFMFLSVGALGIVYELANPGIGGGGAVGAMMIILALFGVAALPVNAVGLALLVVAMALFAAELFAPGIGVAAAGGTAALLLSGVFLFRGTPELQVSAAVLIPVTLVVGGAVVLAGRLVVRSRAAESTTTGTGLFVGRAVEVEQVSGDAGKTFVEGAWWTVRRHPGDPDHPGTGTGQLAPGPARVVAVEGLTLLIEQTGDPGHVPEGPDAPDAPDDHDPPDTGRAGTGPHRDDR